MKPQDKEIGEIVWRISKRHSSIYDMIYSNTIEQRQVDGYEYLECDGDDFNPLLYPKLYELLGETKLPNISNINAATPFIRAKKIEQKAKK